MHGPLNAKFIIWVYSDFIGISKILKIPKYIQLITINSQCCDVKTV